MPIFSHKSSVQSLFHKSGTVESNELPDILFTNLVFKLKVRVNIFLMSQQTHLDK